MNLQEEHCYRTEKDFTIFLSPSLKWVNTLYFLIVDFARQSGSVPPSDNRDPTFGRTYDFL